MKSFDLQAFACPPVGHAPIYGWVWNTVCTEAVIDEQLAEMQRLGIRAFYIIPEPKEFRPHNMATDMAPDYLSPEFFEICAYALKKGTELGMRCWLYDEGGWPSGGACGQVLQGHPELARRVLRAQEQRLPAGSKYQKSAPEILAAFVNDTQPVTEGDSFVVDTVVTEYLMALENNGGTDFPDLLNLKATQRFINITHDRYAAAFGDGLSSAASAMFTDEPKAPYLPFNEDLVRQYETESGQSILPHLPLLAGKAPVTEENIQVLYRWYDLCSRMFRDHFLLPCKNWSNEHGLDFTGHMDMDHEPQGCIRGGGNYHLMRALRCLDIPGVDVIWRQIYPREKIENPDDSNGYNGFFPRYAVSAAVQNGADRVLTETCGVMGPGVTYEDLRYVFGYQAVRGVNLFNLLSISMGRSGTYLGHELPSFTEDQIYFRDLPQMNRYLERLSYVSSLGDRICDIALYYPIHDFWGRKNGDAVAESFDALGRALEARQVDFDIIDDDVIAGATGIEKGMAEIGKGCYRHIIIPENAYIPPKTAEILEQFVKNGGKVSHCAGQATPAVEVLGIAGGLRVSRRKIPGGELLCLFREGGEEKVFNICVPHGRGYSLSLDNGQMQALSVENGILRVCLELGETAVLLFTEEQYPVEKAGAFMREAEITAHFQFQKDRELTAGEKGFTDIVHQEDPVPVSLGSWIPAVGAAYSGSGTYTAEFALEDGMVGKSGMLDLGKVCYSAQVSINGCDLGTVLMPPYRVVIPAGALKKNNELSVTVTNTSANWYVHTDYFDQWSIKQLSPYFEPERKYAKDTVDGGLYGPVKLQLE